MPIAKKPARGEKNVDEFISESAAEGTPAEAAPEPAAAEPAAEPAAEQAPAVEAPAAEAPAAAPAAVTYAPPVSERKDNTRRIAVLAATVSAVTAIAFGLALLKNQGLLNVSMADIKAKGLFAALAEVKPRNPVPAYAMGIAVNQLRQVIRTSDPYKGEVAVLAAMASHDSELAKIVGPLMARSGTGVPTADHLRAEFDQIKAQVAGPVHAQVDPTGLLNRGIAQLRITASRTGASLGNDITGLALARAAAALDDGDLVQAVGELSQFEGQVAGSQLDSWLEDARARLLAQDADAKLEALLVSRLSRR